MTPCRAGTCLLLIALWVSACGGAHAADRCQPRAALAAESPLEVRLDDPGTVVWLEGRLTNALTLPVSPSTFGIRSDESQVLAHDVLVRGQPVGRGALRDDRAALKTDDARGSLWLRFGSQRFVAKVVDHVAQSADGVPLQVSPNLDGEADFDVAQGARVKALGSGEVLIEPGATLRWRPQADRPLKMFLLNATRLSETSPSDTGISGELTPSKAPANAKFTIALNAGGLDLRAHPPTICFAGRSVVAAEDVRFVRQDGDIATIEMRLSREVAAELVRDASWWQRVRGVPAQVRAVAYVDNRPVVDVWLPLRVTSAPWSAAVGVAMLLLVYLTCAVLMRKANPIAIAGGLIQESSGRFSLSNLQVLLWSLLVLFALTFSWASSGQLLTLSASVLGLLGIAGGSSVLSRTVDRMDKAAAPNRCRARRAGEGRPRQRQEGSVRPPALPDARLYRVLAVICLVVGTAQRWIAGPARELVLADGHQQHDLRRRQGRRPRGHHDQRSVGCIQFNGSAHNCRTRVGTRSHQASTAGAGRDCHRRA